MTIRNLFSLKSTLGFEPAANVDLSTIAVAHTTPAAYQVKLGNMANIGGVAYQLRYKLARTGGAAAVNVTIRLKRGNGTELFSKAETIGIGAQVVALEDLDLGTVAGSIPLYIEVEVTGNDAGTAATLYAEIVADTPTIIGGC